MSVHMTKRRIAAGAGIAAVAAAVVAFATQSPGASAPDNPAAVSAAAAMVATPASGLTDGATVSVRATGLQAGTTYTLGQCARVGEIYACNQADLVTVQPQADGSASATLTVRRSYKGTVGPDGKPGPTVNCAAVECGLGMFNEAGDNAGTSISFAK